MAKNVYVVSKTHLDMGYTDLAKNVVNKYIEEYIPKAIEIAKQVNKGKKQFVWTLGSWLINEALKDKDTQRVKNIEEACKRGDIVAHAMPFTVQSELMDTTLMQDAIDIAKELDKRFDRKTISAKMTDVPGHTLGIVPILAKAGIKLLHIGVNKSSAVPNVPKCFVWQCGESQVVVIYEGSYGKTFSHPLIDDILILDHSMDNCGPYSAQKTIEHFEKIKKKYKGYNVVAGTLDDIAEKLWQVKDKLPVITQEIGDSWIHGASSDPYKYGALKMLCDLRGKWLSEGLLDKDSQGYKKFEGNLMCLAEHTCGMGILKGIRDYDNYLKKDFLEARKADAKIKRYGIYRLPCVRNLALKKAKKGIYTKMELSWAEQREYIDNAINALPEKLQVEARETIKVLLPEQCRWEQGEKISPDQQIISGDWKIAINEYGAISNLSYGDKKIIEDYKGSLVDYRSISYKEFSYWLKNYQRDLYKTWTWAIPDFGRPKLRKVARKYPQGTFDYKLADSVFANKGEYDEVSVKLTSPKPELVTELGMPKNLCVYYKLYSDKMVVEVEWTDKDINRLPEEIWLHFGISTQKGDIKYHKLGQDIDPYNIVYNGGRNLSVTEHIDFNIDDNIIRLVPKQWIPVSMGKGKMLRYDNIFGNSAQGVSFMLFNNIWGTNYPLWYGDNAGMQFEIFVVDNSKIEQ